MIDYFKEYNSAQEQISSRKQKIIKNHISHYEVLEEQRIPQKTSNDQNQNQ